MKFPNCPSQADAFPSHD